MKKLLLFLMFSLPMRGQSTLTVTGTIQDSTGHVATSGYVQFDLQPTNSGVQYFVGNVTVLAPQSAQCGINASGLVKDINNTANPCLVWGNDVISPANTTYCVTYAPNGTVTNTVCRQNLTGSSYNLNTPVFAPVVSIVPQFTSIVAPAIQGNLIPSANNVFALGSTNFRYANAFISNITGLNSLNVTSGTLTGSLGINTVSPSSFNGAKLAIEGNVTFQSDQTAYIISGPGFGGAIRFRSNTISGTDRALKLGTVNNSGTFTSLMTLDGDLGGVTNTTLLSPVITTPTINSNAFTGTANRVVFRQAAVRVTGTSPNTISSGVDTVVDIWNLETFDTESGNGLHDCLVACSRLTATVTGKWQVNACVEFTSNATGSRQIRLRKNGTTAYNYSMVPAANGQQTRVCVNDLIDLAAGDYVEVIAFQDSGGTISFFASTLGSFEMYLVSN